MENCIKYQLIGVVQSAELTKLGQLVIKFKPGATGSTKSINSSGYSTWIVKDEVKLTLVGNAHFERDGVNLQKEVTLPAYLAGASDRYVTIVFEDTNEMSLIIDNYYAISTKVSDNKFCVGFPGLFANNSGNGQYFVDAKLRDGFQYMDLYNIDIWSTSFEGTLDDVLNSNIRIFKASFASDLTGDIVKFGKCKNLTKIEAQSTGLHGTVESFVEAIADGMPDGNAIDIRFNNMRTITFNDDTTMPYTGLFTVTKNGNIITITQSSATKGTYNISGNAWTYN